MAASDSSPDADAAASEIYDPIRDRQRRFALLSREDSLKGPIILLVVGLILLVVSASVLGRATGIGAKVAAVGVSTIVALPINLIGLFIIASVLGLGFGSFRSAVIRLIALIVFLQGLVWLVWLGYVATDSVYLLAASGVLVSIVGFALLMDFFDLSIFETIVVLFVLAATQAAADALLEWLGSKGVLELAGSAESLAVPCVSFAQQLPL